MNMKRSLINMAVLSTLGLAGTAGAVTTGVSTGEVLLYPYYSVRNGNDTLITVVNTTGSAKAVKVRFLEAKNSREVLDFNLYLSKHDVWTGVVTTTPAGAKVKTTDTSCTVPAIPVDGQEFRNFQYIGDNADFEDESLDRTREGYIEIIEMGEIIVSDLNDIDPSSATVLFDDAVTHSSGVPKNCAAVSNGWKTSGVFFGTTLPGDKGLSAPSGGLMGTGTLINVAKGTDFSYDPVVMDNFTVIAKHSEPGDLLPSLENVFPKRSVTFYDGTAVTSNWTNNANAADPVSALLMRTAVLNEFTVEPALAAGTDWVVNFPTKRFYIDKDTVNSSDPDSLDWNFERPFTQDFKQGGACEEIGLTIYDREERTTTSDVDFSPRPPSGKNSLCWEVNVITFNSTNVLGSPLAKNVPNQGFNSGWLNLSFPTTVSRSEGSWDRVMISDENHTYSGLPVIGFGVQQYVNGNIDGALSNYGGNFVHKYRRSISNYPQ